MTFASPTERARVAELLARHARAIRSPTWDVLAAWAHRCAVEAR